MGAILSPKPVILGGVFPANSENTREICRRGNYRPKLAELRSVNQGHEAKFPAELKQENKFSDQGIQFGQHINSARGI
jgi:hypothetical protein